MSNDTEQSSDIDEPGSRDSDYTFSHGPVVEKEVDHLAARSDPTGHGRTNLVGLAISGGGIRSATFALGALQSFARDGFLPKVDYLSTVSGGGYIGSSLTWFLHEGGFGLDPEHFPYGTERAEGKRDPAEIVRHLRRHGSYLTPGGGITFPSFVAAILRGTIVSLAVYVGILFSLILLLSPLLLGNIAWTNPLLSSSTSVASLHGEIREAVKDAGATFHLPETINGFSLLAVVGVVVFLLLAFVYAAMTRLSRSEGSVGSWWYKARRRWESWCGRLLCVVAGLVILGTVPWVIAELPGWIAELSSGLTITGVASGIFAYYKSTRSNEKQAIPIGVVAVVGSLFLSYGLLLGLTALAMRMGEGPSRFIGALSVLAASLLFGWLVSINYISIHRYYRDRLMEAYLPDPVAVRSRTARASLAADDARLHDMCCDKDGKPFGPYHIINTNVVLVDSLTARYRGRGGDNFILSPLYSGSGATGWLKTRRFMGGRMTLAAAMAISGAAVNPNAGVSGAGPTRDRFLSFLLNLLNIRLGYWAPNPRRPRADTPSLTRPGLASLAGWDLNETEKYVQLSDGGHFENLGLYELLRRKLKVIVVIDGAADGDYAFGDFANLIERARIDFGVKIDIDLAPIVPRISVGYPTSVHGSAHAFRIGTIDYGGSETGTLVYLKAAIVEGLPNDIYAYKLENEDFPHQTTADQFFDERQFEAYRELGFRLAKSCCADKDFQTLMKDLTGIAA